MIVESIFRLFFGLISFLIGLLPDFNLTGIDWSGLDAFAEVIGYINFFIPVDVIVACMTVLIVYDNFQFFINLFKWLIKLIPAIG